jgi:nicotinamide-nucleotide amidase
MIEIITIGDELLSGETLNTNAHFLSQELTRLGYGVTRHTTLPDEPKRLKSGLQEALQRAKLIIATGGLGPTCDDFTRQVAAELFHSDFVYNETLAQDLERRFGAKLRSLKDQATLPRKASLLPNKIGTAPGLIFEDKLILLPGIPQELRALFFEEVIPFLNRKFPLEKKAVSESLHFCLLIEDQLDALLRELKHRDPQVSIGIYPNYGFLSVRLTAPTSAHLAPFIDALNQAFGSYLFASPNNKLEEAIQEAFVSRKLTLALAESCTGGSLSAHLTAISGSSVYFLGALIAYSDALKKKLLFVSEKTLKEKGAVSKEAIAEMLEGLFRVTSADVAMAVSGIAGPTGGSLEKPVGTIWAGLAMRGEGPDIWTFKARGNRETIILSTTYRLFGALLRKVVYGKKGGSHELLSSG